MTEPSSPGLLPPQRWQIPPPQPAAAQALAEATGLSPLIAQVLLNRGIDDDGAVREFLDPEAQQLPSPLAEFPDLPQSLDLLQAAIANQQKIAICGDYDADGMTSTALLLRALRGLGAQVDYTIPSRMQEGYGINRRIVDECYADGVGLILTVDNGIAAVDPIAHAQTLGLTVIVTDHHDIPPQLPPASAILNPKLLPETSPYRGVAGVGVAYVLAVCLAQALGQTQALTAPLLELFTLGTIADLAPLTGVNRRWVRRGLGLLPRSRNLGIQALIQVAGLDTQDQSLKPEDIGFRLGPRINAVGRISDPQIVIELLTTEDIEVAIERAMQCEQINKERQELCQQIEQEAVAWCEQAMAEGQLDLQQERVLVVVQPHWHHGVIGIVASRLVERYGVPVFIGTYEDEQAKTVRGSARGIPEFDVYEALHHCDDLLEKYGGHRAAGGFSFAAKHLRPVQARLAHYARSCLELAALKPLVTVDVQASLAQLTPSLHAQIDRLQPCGIENPAPVFWTTNVEVIRQQTVGRNQDHLKLEIREGSTQFKGIAWRRGDCFPLPQRVDMAYRLHINDWQGQQNLELEVVGFRAASIGDEAVRDQPNGVPAVAEPPSAEPPSAEPPSASAGPQVAPTVATPTIPAPPPSSTTTSPRSAESAPPPLASDLPNPPTPTPDPQIDFFYSQRRYWAGVTGSGDHRQLTISNPEGHLLRVQLATRQGTLYPPGGTVRAVDISEAYYFNLVQAGLNALEIQQQAQQLTDQATQIAALQQQVHDLEAALAKAVRPTKALGSPHPSPGPGPIPPAVPRAGSHPTPMPPSVPSADPSLMDPDPADPDSAPAHHPDPEASLPDASTDTIPPLRDRLGQTTWFCLSQASHQNLEQASHHLAQINPQDPAAISPNHAAAARHLGAVVQRELAAPLQALLQEHCPTSGHGGLLALVIAPAATQAQALPAFLSKTWQRLKDPALHPATHPPSPLYQTVRSASRMKALKLKLDAAAQDDVKSLLAAWDHPLAHWYREQGRAAATALEQNHQLTTVAEGEMCGWQLDLLLQLIVGTPDQPGILTQALTASPPP